MIHKIKNFNESVPFGAQYVGVLNERNGVLSVQYFIDPEGRNPAYSHSLQNLVMMKEELQGIIGEVAASEAEDQYQNTTGGVVLTVIEVQPVRNLPHDEWPEIGEPFTVVDTGQDRGMIPAGVRVGDVLEIPAQDRARVIIKVRILSIDEGEELLSMESKDYSTPMSKLDDTTKVAGQNTRKPRKGDKADGKIKDDEYYSDGEDNRGVLRFPHSDAEKQFYDAHGELKIYDHPANTKDWSTTVTNKDMSAKIKLGEDNAPLSSSEESFFLKESESVKFSTAIDKIEEFLSEPIQRLRQNAERQYEV